MNSDTRGFRWGIWAVVFFVLAVSVPGWYIQMRLIEKLGRLERRVTELESRYEVGGQGPDSAVPVEETGAESQAPKGVENGR